LWDTVFFENEDKHWLLSDIVSKEEDIENNKEYMSTYYDQYYSIARDLG